MDKPRPEPPDTPQWYYMDGGDSCGPIPSSELRHLVASNQIPAETLVWREGMHDWLSASDLGLTRPAASPVPPPVAAPVGRAPLPVSDRQESATVERARLRRGSVPRRAANARRWAWGITAAITLLVVGFAVGQVLQKRADKPQAAGSTAAAGPRHAKVPRDSGSGRVSSTSAQGTPRRNKRQVGDDTGGKSLDVAVIPSPLRTGERPTGTADTPAVDAAAGTMETGEASRTNTKTLGDGPPAALYQDVTVHSSSSFGGAAIAALAAMAKQETQYSILSQLNLQPRLDDGSVRVTQQVLDTRLDRCDASTRGSRAADLAKLKGKRFVFTLNAKSEVTSFEGYESSLSATPIELAGGKGFQTTNVLDKDAWREVIQLSFLEPARHIAPGQNWTRQMAHDFPPLGKWNGVTTFSQDTAKPPPLLYFKYSHDMKFTPSASPDSGLPFGLGVADVRLVNAAGSFVYDPAEQHVTQVDESFHVKLTVGTELSGEAGKLEVDARQQWTIKLTTQHPWR